jgi:glycosyltransferase involved in cell wall biosynthesis
VRKVLLAIGSLDYGGPARQLTLLARHLSRERFDVRVASLGPPTPWAEALQRAGVEVESLGWKRPIDLRPFTRLYWLARTFSPDLVHAWGPAAFRAILLGRVAAPHKVLASSLLPPAGAPGRLDSWLMARVRRIVALGEAEAERYRRLGVAEDRLGVLTPGVELPAPAEPASLPGLPPEARVILAVGPVEAHKGYREAVWALDILAHLYDDVHLVIAGTGPDRPRVEEFARSIRVLRRVHFPGACPDLAPWWARADVVWVPSLREGGRCAALEAMAAGRPVVASSLPGLAEVVADGVTGFLVPPDDKARLARQTRVLLDDPGLRRALGEAGRRRAAEQFGVGRLADEAARLYEM